MTETHRCIFCGKGELNEEGVCNVCGNVSTERFYADEALNSYLDEALKYRNDGHFDQALDWLDEIIEYFPDRPQGYFASLTATYGVTYPIDETTGKASVRIARFQELPVLNHTLYLNAIANCKTPEEKESYVQAAKAIEDERLAMKAIVDGIEPSQIFVCCKRTEKDGSVIKYTRAYLAAKEIAAYLTDAGYSVFVDQRDYEPADAWANEAEIYKATTSSKMMIAVFSSKDEANDYKVKETINGFLDLDESGEKILIPVLVEVEEKDLPSDWTKDGVYLLSVGLKAQLLDLAAEKLKGYKKKKKKAEEEDISAPTVLDIPSIPNKRYGSGVKRMEVGLGNCGHIRATYLETKKFTYAYRGYKKILKTDPNDADAAWGCILALAKACDEGSLITNENVAVIFADNLDLLILSIEKGYITDAKTRLEYVIGALCNNLNEKKEKKWMTVFDAIIGYCLPEQRQVLGVAAFWGAKTLIADNKIDKKSLVELVAKSDSVIPVNNVREYSQRNTDIGECLRIAGRFDEAIFFLNKSLVYAPADDRTVWLKFLCEVKSASDEQDLAKVVKDDGCVRTLKRLIADQYDENSADYFNEVVLIAERLVCRGKIDLACKIFDGLALLYPATPEATAELSKNLYRFSTVLLLNAKWKKAAEYYKQLYDFEQSPKALWGILKAVEKKETEFDILCSRKDCTQNGYDMIPNVYRLIQGICAGDENNPYKRFYEKFCEVNAERKTFDFTDYKRYAATIKENLILTDVTDYFATGVFLVSDETLSAAEKVPLPAKRRRSSEREDGRRPRERRSSEPTGRDRSSRSRTRDSIGRGGRSRRPTRDARRRTPSRAGRSSGDKLTFRKIFGNSFVAAFIFVFGALMVLFCRLYTFGAEWSFRISAMVLALTLFFGIVDYPLSYKSANFYYPIYFLAFGALCFLDVKQATVYRAVCDGVFAVICLFVAIRRWRGTMGRRTLRRVPTFELMLFSSSAIVITNYSDALNEAGVVPALTILTTLAVSLGATLIADLIARIIGKLTSRARPR